MWALKAGNHTLSMHFTSVCLPRPAPLRGLFHGEQPHGEHLPTGRAGQPEGQGQPHSVVTFLTQPCSNGSDPPAPSCSCGTACIETKVGWLQLKEQLCGSLGSSAAPVFGKEAAKQKSHSGHLEDKD